MKNVAKIAVSIPTGTLRGVERRRRDLHLTRSAAVTQALEAWTRQLDEDDSDAAYSRAYLRTPERLDESMVEGVVAALAWSPWK